MPGQLVKLPGRGVNVAGREIPVVADGDLIVRLIDSSRAPLRMAKDNAAVVGTPQTYDFRVSRRILAANSPVFASLVSPSMGAPVVVVEGNAIRSAMHIWLCVLHHGSEGITEDLHAKSVKLVWTVLAIGNMYGFDGHIMALKPWFAEFYKSKVKSSTLLEPDGPALAGMLMFPCAVFDHAEGFMKLTKCLALNVKGSSCSINPTMYDELNVPARIYDGPIMGAKMHMQETLSVALNVPVQMLRRADCACRKETMFDYQDLLFENKVLPLESAFRRYTIKDILDFLQDFSFEAATKSCTSGACTRNFKRDVDIALAKTLGDFEGLCLDCVKRSQPHGHASHEDYIEANMPFKNYWDTKCSFGHGINTWCLSWMGASNHRQQILSAYMRASGRVQRADVHDKAVSVTTVAMSAGGEDDKDSSDLGEEFFDAEDRVCEHSEQGYEKRGTVGE